MKQEDVLAPAPTVLTQAQRAFYWKNGYLLLEAMIDADWLARLRARTAAVVAESRAITKSDATFDLEPGHGPDSPRLRRLSSPTTHDPLYWQFAAESIVPDIAADLIGPDVKFHHAKLNFKWADGGEEVKWHQDAQFSPHTNFSPLTIGVYLEDVGPGQAPLGVVPGSHEGPLYDQYNDKGQWIGCLADADVARARCDNAVYLSGPAGSLTIHNCRTVHGSRPNASGQGRPLLLNVYSAADAFPYAANALPSPHDGTIVRGKPARWARHDPRPGQVPPDWSGGYTSLFALQQGEDWDEEQRRPAAE